MMIRVANVAASMAEEITNLRKWHEPDRQAPGQCFKVTPNFVLTRKLLSSFHFDGLGFLACFHSELIPKLLIL
jgi:hypothetical protein